MSLGHTNISHPSFCIPCTVPYCLHGYVPLTMAVAKTGPLALHHPTPACIAPSRRTSDWRLAPPPVEQLLLLSLHAHSSVISTLHGAFIGPVCFASRDVALYPVSPRCRPAALILTNVPCMIQCCHYTSISRDARIINFERSAPVCLPPAVAPIDARPCHLIRKPSRVVDQLQRDIAPIR